MTASKTKGAESPARRPNDTHGPRRISIVGCSGSGKTYLARQLALHLSAPLYELDHLRRADGRALRPDEFRDLVDSLSQREEWVIDGHYRDVRHMIWQRADAVIWLNYPLSIIGFRLLMRFRRKQVHNVREQPPQCAEQAVRPVPPPAASWRQRFTRFCRSLPERHEYRRLLTSAQYAHVAVFEMTSTRRTAAWLRSLSSSGELRTWRAPAGSSPRDRPRKRA